jgi:hypothetical protein
MLSVEEVAFFKREGWLLLRDVLDPGLIERAVDNVWSTALPSMRRDEPASWWGTVEEHGLESEESHAVDVRHEGLRWIVRKSAKEDWMLNLAARNPLVAGPVKQLLGQELNQTGTRGVYSTRPCFTRAGRRLAPKDCPPIVGVSDRGDDAGATSILGGEGIHTDGLPLDRIGAVGYLQDSPSGSGGFTIWPRSHRWLFEQIGRKVLPEADGCNQVGKSGGGVHAPVPHPLPLHHLARRTVLKQHPEGFQVAGKRGDVVLWHGMLLHTVGLNYDKNSIRMAVLADFSAKDGRSGAEMCTTDPDDMWTQWSREVRDAPIGLHGQVGGGGGGPGGSKL